jgi:hypothetical protein
MDRRVLAEPDDAELRGDAGGAWRFDLQVPVTSSNTTVGTIVTSPVVFNLGASNLNAVFNPATAGTAVISLTTPSGFHAEQFAADNGDQP